MIATQGLLPVVSSWCNGCDSWFACLCPQVGIIKHVTFGASLIHWIYNNFQFHGQKGPIKAVEIDENSQASRFSIKMCILLQVSFTLMIQHSNPLHSADLAACSMLCIYLFYLINLYISHFYLIYLYVYGLLLSSLKVESLYYHRMSSVSERFHP